MCTSVLFLRYFYSHTRRLCFLFYFCMDIDLNFTQIWMNMVWWQRYKTYSENNSNKLKWIYFVFYIRKHLNEIWQNSYSTKFIRYHIHHFAINEISILNLTSRFTQRNEWNRDKEYYIFCIHHHHHHQFRINKFDFRSWISYADGLLKIQ